MGRVYRWFDRVDPLIVRWMAKNGVFLLRISLGVVFLWFGALKFFPGLSPAETLAGRTIERLTGGLISQHLAVPMLATWESLIGIGLLLGVFMRAARGRRGASYMRIDRSGSGDHREQLRGRGFPRSYGAGKRERGHCLAR